MNANTNEIVHNKQDQQSIVDLKTVLTWYPADYMHECGRCNKESLYHTCIPIDIQWEYVLHNIIYRDEKHYNQVYKSVLENGFIAPLRAKVAADNNIVLLDGHNRVGVALDMSVQQVPVFVGNKTVNADELIAPDSGWWRLHNKPWTSV